ncbi:MAG: hypothetical protein II707_05385 [Spirochaetales bacterium]|nr:hypothetical protein [Spirochaetales bacterium]
MKFDWKIIFSYRRIIGVYLILAGVLVALNVMFPKTINSFVVALSILLILSVDIMLRGLSRKQFGLIASGSSVALASLLGLIIFLLHWPIEKIWPLFGFCASLGFIFSFLVSDKRRMSLLIPSIFIGLMSALILCFTTDFINLNSKYLLFFSVALLLMLSGVLMVCQGQPGNGSTDNQSSQNEISSNGQSEGEIPNGKESNQ